MSSLATVGILTFHRCINYGSYWQARCLVNGLRARGYDAILLDHDSREVRLAEWRCAFQPRLPTRTDRRNFGQYKRKARKLLDAVEALPLSVRFELNSPDQLPRRDVVIVGSDEVWNMCHPWYGGQPIFYGSGIQAQRLASYAASFGNHDASIGLDDAWAEKLRNFSSISVRDANSRTMIEQALGIRPELVLDPVLQFPDEALKDRSPAEPGSYVAVYGHGFPAWFAQSVGRWARRNGRKLISIGYENEWADEQQIAASPGEFSHLIAGASAVVTNFFHGCVFALLHRRPFATAISPYRANKIRDLMHGLGGGVHLVDEYEEPEHIADVLSTPPSNRIYDRLAEHRARSDAYLSHVLS